MQARMGPDSSNDNGPWSIRALVMAAANQPFIEKWPVLCQQSLQPQTQRIRQGRFHPFAHTHSLLQANATSLSPPHTHTVLSGPKAKAHTETFRA